MGSVWRSTPKERLAAIGIVGGILSVLGSVLRWATVTGNLLGSRHLPMGTLTGIHYRTIESHVAYVSIGIGVISVILGLVDVALMTAVLSHRSSFWMPAASALCGAAVLALSVRAIVDIYRARSGPFQAHPDAGVWVVVIGGAVILMVGIAQLWASRSPAASGIPGSVTASSPT